MLFYKYMVQLHLEFCLAWPLHLTKGYFSAANCVEKHSQNDQKAGTTLMWGKVTPWAFQLRKKMSKERQRYIKLFTVWRKMMERVSFPSLIRLEPQVIQWSWTVGILRQTKLSTCPQSEWNLLPHDVMITTNVNSFKRELHKFMKNVTVNGCYLWWLYITSSIRDWFLKNMNGRVWLCSYAACGVPRG